MSALNPSRPQPFHIPFNRRRLLKSMAAASAGWALPGYLAEALTIAPSLTQGPYYPLADDIPLDKDNDLVQLGDSLTPAAGIITHLTGRILDASGNPVRDALVELWHADREGDYVYSTGTGRNTACDANFAGFGQFLTSSTGAYRFRTVKAGLYNGRTHHYHIACTFPGQKTRYCTQLFWNEAALGLTGSAWATQNANDSIWTGIPTAAQRQAVTLDYTAVEGTTTGEVAGTFDFALGLTPVEPTYPASGGFVAQGEMVAGYNSAARYKITVPVYAGYTYEIYGNPTLADLDWQALPFSLTQTGAVDRNKYTATAEGSISFYLDTAATRGFYKVSFRIPGVNTGTP